MSSSLFPRQDVAQWYALNNFTRHDQTPAAVRPSFTAPHQTPPKIPPRWRRPTHPDGFSRRGCSRWCRAAQRRVRHHGAMQGDELRALNSNAGPSPRRKGSTRQDERRRITVWANALAASAPQDDDAGPCAPRRRCGGAHRHRPSGGGPNWLDGASSARRRRAVCRS